MLGGDNCLITVVGRYFIRTEGCVLFFVDLMRFSSSEDAVGVLITTSEQLSAGILVVDTRLLTGLFTSYY